MAACITYKIMAQISIFVLLGLNIGNDYTSSMPGSCSSWVKKTSLRLIEVNSKYFTEV